MTRTEKENIVERIKTIENTIDQVRYILFHVANGINRDSHDNTKLKIGLCIEKLQNTLLGL